MSDLERRDIYVSNLQSALSDGQHGLNAVPGHIKQIIQEDMWQDRIVQVTGERAEYDTFTAFVNDSPPKGLGADVDMLKRMCDNDPEALRLLREVVTDSPGGDQRSDEAQTKNDNIINESGQGTSKDYTLDRLARERPDFTTPLPQALDTPRGDFAILVDVDSKQSFELAAALPPAHRAAGGLFLRVGHTSAHVRTEGP